MTDPHNITTTPDSATIRRQALEDAAKEMCANCRDYGNVIVAKDAYAYHVFSTGGVQYDCHASPIHAMIQREQEQEKQPMNDERLDKIESRLDAMESDGNLCTCNDCSFARTAMKKKDKTPATPPICPKCNGTKMYLLGDESQGHLRVTGNRLCSCLKVGDVVGRDVVNLLPVGSVFELDGNRWTQNNDGWFAYGSTHPITRWFLQGSHTLLRIGPGEEAATTTSDDHPSNCACPDCEPDDKPDKAEEIACECINFRNSGLLGWRESITHILRKHGVGQPLPLADLLADERIRPLVDVVKAARVSKGQVMLRGMKLIWEAVDALPPELRAAVEAVE